MIRALKISARPQVGPQQCVGFWVGSLGNSFACLQRMFGDVGFVSSFAVLVLRKPCIRYDMLYAGLVLQGLASLHEL